MNLKISGQTFKNVVVPVLWGSRAILEDGERRISVVNLEGKTARLEVLGDKPAPGVDYRPTVEGFDILEGGECLYAYNSDSRILTPGILELPPIEFAESMIRVGTNQYVGDTVTGYGVGLLVTKESISMGAPLPQALAKLAI